MSLRRFFIHRTGFGRENLRQARSAFPQPPHRSLLQDTSSPSDRDTAGKTASVFVCRISLLSLPQVLPSLRPLYRVAAWFLLLLWQWAWVSPWAWELPLALTWPRASVSPGLPVRQAFRDQPEGPASPGPRELSPDEHRIRKCLPVPVSVHPLSPDHHRSDSKNHRYIRGCPPADPHDFSVPAYSCPQTCRNARRHAPEQAGAALSATPLPENTIPAFSSVSPGLIFFPFDALILAKIRRF